MAFFAEIDSTNTVTQVHCNVPDSMALSGQQYINNVLKLSGTWIQTDPWTFKGRQYTRVIGLSTTAGYILSAITLDSTITPQINIPNTTITVTDLSGLRYNFAKTGYTYDSVRDAFIPPKPHRTWILDEATCTWVSPVPVPEDIDRHHYKWDDDTMQWTYVLPISTIRIHYLSGGKPGESVYYKF